MLIITYHDQQIYLVSTIVKYKKELIFVRKHG